MALQTNTMKKSKTDLLHLLRQTFLKASNNEFANNPHLPELPSRRSFIKNTLIGATGMSLLPSLPSFAQNYLADTNEQKAKVGILGAGIAGLHAAYILQQNGIRAEVFEGSNRTGGRMYTTKGLLGKNITTELGGEFIDSTHEDILNLATEFNLPLIDTNQDAHLTKQIFYFNGHKYTASDLVKSWKPYLQKITADIESLPEEITYKSHQGAERFDKMSIETYLQKKGIKGWLFKLLQVAFTTEFGMDINQQSALNFLFLFKPEKSDDLFGDSDERYKIEGGNQRITDELTKRLPAVKLNHSVTKIAQHKNGFYVYFSNGKKRYVDYLICTIPFTQLRKVVLQIPAMTKIKKKCIHELGYGMNAKMFAGYKTKIWRQQHASGQCFTDLPFQLGWDSSQLQQGKEGGYTFLTGGKGSIAMKSQPLDIKVKEYVSQLNQVFKNSGKEYNGKKGIFYWPDHPYTQGSYACYKVGQWTSIGGAEAESIGNLFFAGEHCSVDFQGFMNGGAETGRVAAMKVLSTIPMQDLK